MAEQTANHASILIVDDTPININVLFDTLEQEGFKVLIASNGESALERAEYGQPDVILLDIMMPGIDGFETCKRLKANPATASIPVIFMTALTETVDKMRGFEAGAVDYITKPFQTEEVLARVNAHLTIQRLQRELIQANENLEKKVEERTHELSKAKERAEHSDQLKTEFLAQISHEIRTPVNAILSFSGLIEMQLNHEPDAELKQTLDIIQRGGKRLVRTFDLILNMSQVQAGTHECTIENIDLHQDVLREVFSRYKIAAEEKNVEFTLEKQTEEVRVESDVQMLMTVFENIVDNALNFTPEGSVTLTLRNDGDHTVAVDITDTGIGIGEDFLPSLYEPFLQEDQGYSRRFEGNGLGLALAKRYCDMLNAELKVTSEKGKGSTFTVLLPKV